MRVFRGATGLAALARGVVPNCALKARENEFRDS
jgi:hypothetical protein